MCISFGTPHRLPGKEPLLIEAEALNLVEVLATLQTHAASALDVMYAPGQITGIRTNRMDSDRRWLYVNMHSGEWHSGGNGGEAKAAARGVSVEGIGEGDVHPHRCDIVS